MSVKFASEVVGPYNKTFVGRFSRKNPTTNWESVPKELNLKLDLPVSGAMSTRLNFRPRPLDLQKQLPIVRDINELDPPTEGSKDALHTVEVRLDQSLASSVHTSRK